MKIIIEGIDCVGKTTQIENIINYYNLPFVKIHSYAPSKKLNSKLDKIEFEKELYKDVFKIIKNYKNVILDRAHLGVKVYGNIYRNYKDEDLKWVNELEKDVIEDVKLIVLVDNAEKNIARDKDRNDGKTFTHDVKKKQLEINLFKKAYYESEIENKIIIDISIYDGEKAVFNEIIKFLEGEK